MKDLTQAMGINSPSLYGVYGDKRGLYLQAIERYINHDSCAPMDAFEAEPDIHLAVRAFMLAALDNATEHPQGLRGCFMANCVSTDAGSVEGVEALLQQAINSADLRLTARFEKEQQRGTLPEQFPCAERARLMFDLRQGLVLRARANLDRQSMEADIDSRVAMVLLCNFH